MVTTSCRLMSRTTGFLMFLALASAISNATGQPAGYSYYYRVYYTDKGNLNTGDFKPEDLLGERAVARRNKAGIAVPDYYDLPVNPDYISQTATTGLILHCTSKWMNTGLFRSQNPADINALMNLPFIREVKLVKRPGVKSTYTDKLDIQNENAGIPPFDSPISMVNGYSLNNSGYDGKGIVIAVLDGGFYKTDIIQSLEHLRDRGGIKGTRDFVNGNGFVYSYHNHGTSVLSVLAGVLPWQIAGTAPGADYWLLRTEDTSSEFPVEEDFWAAGAEYADSAGADIISSSLGYYTFDDPAMNYKFDDLDGNTAFVTMAADVAASKGILVVASAGNERNKPWVRIIAPTDGDSVLSAGAVDGYNLISSFSSAGPSADGRIKPDNVAQGVSVPVQVTETEIIRANGTSFSCPVLSGVCACVMQAVPEATNIDIIKTLHLSGDKYNSPDSLYGYGLPDMAAVLTFLQDKYVKETEIPSVAGPNPFTGIFEITFSEAPGTLQIDIFNISGKLILTRYYNQFISRTLTITDLQNREQGLYIIRLKTSKGTFTNKVIKTDG